MGYERFVKKIFPFIGNQYNFVENAKGGETPIPEKDYEIDGHHYAFKHRIYAAMKQVDGHSVLALDLYKNDVLVNKIEFEPEAGDIEFLDIMALQGIKASAIEAKPYDYLNRVLFNYENLIKFVDGEADIEEYSMDIKYFVGYPPYMAIRGTWDAQAFGVKELYANDNHESSDDSSQIVFYYNK